MRLRGHSNGLIVLWETRPFRVKQISHLLLQQMAITQWLFQIMDVLKLVLVLTSLLLELTNLI